jgi:Invasin, domain 3
MKTTSIRTLSTCLILTAMVLLAGISHGQLINVNFTGGTAETESALSGPGGGSGTTWNQYAGPDSPGTLVTSTGAATTVTITSNFDLPNTFDSPVIDLPMLRGSMTNFGKGVDNTNVTISGLEAGGFYDIWMVTLRNQGFWNEGTEQYVGWWSTTNGTTSPSNQLVNAVGPTNNTSTFVAGYNYVLFENVEANGSGNIVFTGVAGELLNGSDNNHRHGLNGLQIEKTTPPVVGVVVNAMSTVDASPATVFADGVLTSTVTVTLRDANGNGVPNKSVTLASTPGPPNVTINPLTAVTTNGAGQAVFNVSSATPGTEVFTATDVTDSLTLTDTASVEFVEVGVLTNAAQSTVVASPIARLADGSSTSTITVTLRDANGYPVAGNNVTLANSGGPQAATISPAGAVTSNASGQAVFSVSSSTIGAVEFTATDTTDSILVTQIATVSFIDPNAPKFINVNFTGGQSPAPAETGLVGPAGGLLTNWNQLNTTSSGPLVDSTGAATTAAISLTNLGFTAYDTPTIDLTMLRGSFTNFDKGVDTTNVTISGLAPGGFYNIWMVTLRNQGNGGDGTEQYVGWWSTTNATTSPSNQLVNAVGPTVNTSTFVDGYNYVRFETVEADGSGNIVFTGVAGDQLDGSDNNHRLGLNGLQIEETDPPLARILTIGVPGSEGVINEGAKTISLTVPYGTNLATLAPTFTLSSGTCNQTSGSPPSPSFATSNPVQYIVTDTSTDPDTVNTYTVTLSGSLVIDLGTSPAGTTIAGGSFIGSGPTNLPLPTLPTGSILRSIAINSKLEATDNDNFTSDLALLLDPTPGAPGGNFSVEISNGETSFGGTVQLDWPASANSGVGTVLADIKTDATWAAVAPIDLATTGLFLGNAYGGPTTGGTWSGTITLVYDMEMTGGPTYATWSGGAPADGDANNDGVKNAVAWVLGAADPDENAVALIPTLDNTSDPDFFIFNHRRSDTANGDASTAIKVEYSSDLVNWPDAVAGPDIVITPFNDAYAAGIDRVEVKIRRTLAVGGKLFARLNVEVTP